MPYPSPLDGAQGRTDYMTSVTVLLVLVDVVAEVRRVPDHHVLAADVFTVDEAVDGDRSVRLWVTSLARGCGDAVVDLVSLNRRTHTSPRAKVSATLSFAPGIRS